METITAAIGSYAPFLPEEVQAPDINTVHVADGMNFAWKTDGVYKAYGSLPAQIAPTLGRFSKTVHIQGVRYIATGSGVYRIEDDKSYTLMQESPAHVNTTDYDLSTYRWSYGYVGTSHWFCHPLCDELIWYDQHADTWGTYRDGCWEGPLFSITHGDNSLFLQLQDVITWSQFDEGTSFGCDWTKGMGSQSLALIRYGQPLGVMPYSGAVVSFTSMGIMLTRPDFTPVPAPADNQQLTSVRFKHEEVTFDRLPLGPLAITHADEKQVVWLSNRGLMQFGPSQGGGFGGLSTFEPAMGMFYKDVVIPQLPNAELSSVEYQDDLGWLFVSTNPSGLGQAHEQAHVWQYDLQRWGSFNHEHTHVGIGADGTFMSYWDGVGREHCVDHGTLNSPSWVKFTPFRLQAPTEFIGTDNAVSVQQARVARGRPAFTYIPKGNINSTWWKQVRNSQEPTDFGLIVSGGRDSHSFVFDEQEYAHLVSRTEEVTQYSCHVTGIAINMFATALSDGEHYQIKTISVGFFYAGVF